MSLVSATEAARQFSDLLNRLRYRQESFEIVRGGEVVARLVPSTQHRANVRQLFELLAGAVSSTAALSGSCSESPRLCRGIVTDATRA
ncbi:MAG TPA: hypothetical protein VF331_22475 [Polyangiales bacterium]